MTICNNEIMDVCMVYIFLLITVFEFVNVNHELLEFIVMYSSLDNTLNSHFSRLCPLFLVYQPRLYVFFFFFFFFLTC